FLAVMLLYGVACALTSRTVAGALILTSLLPLLVNFGTLLLLGLFEGMHALVLWPLTAAGLLVTRRWVRRSAGSAAVATFLIAVHLALACVGTCWTVGRDLPYPIAAMHPGFLAFITLDTNFERDFRKVPWFAV